MWNFHGKYSSEGIKERTSVQNLGPEKNLEGQKYIQKDSTHGNMEKKLKQSKGMHYLCCLQQGRNLQTLEGSQKNSRRDCNSSEKHMKTQMQQDKSQIFEEHCHSLKE